MSYTPFRHGYITDEVHLGRGTLGFVKKARWGNSTVAIKYLLDSSEMHAELDNLKRVHGGEHTIGFYGLIMNEHGQTGMVMEYCVRGTLQDYLVSNFLQFSWDDKFNMAQEIAQGLRFVHQNGLLHRHLHDRNILIDDGRHALIADFGLARPIDRVELGGNKDGHLAFIPPERLGKVPGPFTKQGDIYSLGSILWELTSGRQPLHETPNIAASRAMFEGIQEEPVDGTPKWYQELYTRCWAMDPMERPNLDHVVQHLTWRGRYYTCFHVHSMPSLTFT
jgi:serine/threonine protein kinase